MGRGARRRPRLLAAKLRQIRDGLSLSQGALIERLGVGDYINQGEISDFEHGVREPDLLTLKAYADVAGISTDALIDDAATLPDQLPGANVNGPGKKTQSRAKATMNTTVVRLRLLIESKEGSSREETRAQARIEKVCLKPHGMKKLPDEYELTFSHQDETGLNEQVYALISGIIIEGRKRKCSIAVSAQEKGNSDHYW